MARACVAGEGDRAERIGALTRQSAEASVEFGHCLSNHLPMVLPILDRLGASPERCAAWAETYTNANGLRPAPPDQGRIGAESWREHLGRRELEGDYRGFFSREVARLGARETERLYLPVLVPGIAASALHALMRLAYAHLREDPSEVATALGYWAATWLPLGAAGRASPVSDDPAALLDALRGIEALRHVAPPPSDLLWHWMRDVAAQPAFPPVVDLLAETPDMLPRLAHTSLALMAGTMTFEALHAVTAMHWVRVVRRRLARSRPRRALCLAGAGGRLSQDRHAAAAGRGRASGDACAAGPALARDRRARHRLRRRARSQLLASPRWRRRRPMATHSTASSPRAASAFWPDATASWQDDRVCGARPPRVPESKFMNCDSYY